MAVNTNQKTSIDFFVALRKDPQIKRILTTLAREPSGVSRIPREMFQEVFERMEKETQTKTLDWPTIVEFFTKRGRPLSDDEMKALHEQDRMAELEYQEMEEKQRREEEEALKLHRQMQGIKDPPKNAGATQSDAMRRMTPGQFAQKAAGTEDYGADTLNDRMHDHDLELNDQVLTAKDYARRS